MNNSIYTALSAFVILICCCRSANSKPGPALAYNRITQAVDSIVIIKHSRLLIAYHHHTVLKSFHICLGPEPTGKKHFKDDGKTPEGLYFINGKNAKSHYHKCLGLSYPNNEDRKYAQSQGKPTGGDIKIHGLPNGKGFMAKEFSAVDWTLGCIALTDEEIDELYPHVLVGTIVNIVR